MQNQADNEIRVKQFQRNKNVIYIAKEKLLTNEKINIIASTNSAGIASRAAELLIHFGFCAYDNIRTETIIENHHRQTRMIITLKKTNEFNILYQQSQEIKKLKSLQKASLEPLPE